MSARTLLRNTGALTLGRALGDFFVFLMLVVVAREFGPEGNGRYGVAMSIAGFIAVFADFGMRGLTLKEMSNRSARSDLLGAMLVLRVPLSVISFGALALALPYIGLGRESGILALLIAIQQLLRRACEGLGLVFVAREQAHVASALELAAKGVGAIGAILVMQMGGSLVVAVAVLPLAEVLHLLVALVAVHRWAVPLRAVFDVRRLREMLRAARPYAASSVLGQLYSRVDVLLIGLLLGASAAGLYHVADRVIVVALLIPAFVSMALFPSVTRALSGSGEQAGQLCRTSIGNILLVGVPATFALTALAPLLVGAVFGEAFAQSVTVLRVLAPMVLFVGLAECLGVFLVASGRVATRVRQQALAAVLNLCGNLALIPTLGIEGAAVATVVTRVLLVVTHARSLADVLAGTGPAGRMGLACGVVGAVCCAVAMGPGAQAGTWAVLCAAAYATCLALFPEQPRALARYALRGRIGAPSDPINGSSAEPPRPPQPPGR